MWVAGASSWLRRARLAAGPVAPHEPAGLGATGLADAAESAGLPADVLAGLRAPATDRSADFGTDPSGPATGRRHVGMADTGPAMRSHAEAGDVLADELLGDSRGGRVARRRTVVGPFSAPVASRRSPLALVWARPARPSKRDGGRLPLPEHDPIEHVLHLDGQRLDIVKVLAPGRIALRQATSQLLLRRLRRLLLGRRFHLLLQSARASPGFVIRVRSAVGGWRRALPHELHV